MKKHERIRHARKGLGLTQAQVGAQAGVSHATVARWESGGGIQLENAEAIARALGYRLALVDVEE